jgi:predicted transcriptional regulator
MTLRLDENQMQALRETAVREHRSMQEVARDAIAQYTSRRSGNRDALIHRIGVEHARVLRRLGE